MNPKHDTVGPAVLVTRDPSPPPRARPTRLRIQSIRDALANPLYRSMRAYEEAQDLLAEVDALLIIRDRERRWLDTLRTLTRGIPEVEALLRHLQIDEAWIPTADWGPSCASVESRAKALLDLLDGTTPTAPLDRVNR